MFIQLKKPYFGKQPGERVDVEEANAKTLIEQGIAEGVFATESPRETAAILMMLMTGFQDTATDLFLARQANAISFQEAERTMTSFTHAVERVLGARKGSIHTVDQKTLHEWFG